MKLITNWRAQLNRLWSVRIAVLAALLASGDQILAALSGAGVISPIVYAVLFGVLVAVRMIQQKPANDPAAAP